MNEQQRAEFESTLAMVMEVMDAANTHVISLIDRQEKLKWLEEFGRQSLAWNVAVDLLSRPNYQIQAASMLTSKINQSWNSLLKEHKKELCDVVLTTIGDAASSPSLKSSLCITVTMIILQSTPHEWPDPISDTLYLSQYGPESPCDTREIWVDLVKTIAEEANKQPKHIPQAQHDILKKYIKDVSAELVIKTLLVLLEQSCGVIESRLAEDALGALSKWYALGPAVTPVIVQTVDCIVSSVLVNPADLTSPAAEVISELLLVFTLPQYPQSIALILEQVLRLAPLLTQAMESMEIEVVSSLVSIFTSVGINQPSVMVSSRENGAILTQLILQCCELKEAISSEVYDFWKDLQDILEGDKDYDDLLDLYKGAFEDMVRVLLKQCRYTEDVDDSEVDSDVSPSRLRKDASETLLQFYRMIPDEELGILYDLLESSISNHERQPTTETESWIEVALWGWTSVSEDFVDEQHWPAKLLKLLHTLPSNSILIQKSALDLIRALSPWLAYHPDALPMALHYICSALEITELAAQATSSLGAICDDCGEHLPELLEDLMEKLEPVMGGLPSREQCNIIASLSSQVTFLEPQLGLNLLSKLAGSLPSELVALTQETNQFNLLQRERLINGLNFIIALLVSPGDPSEREEDFVLRRIQVLRPAPKMGPDERYMAQVNWSQNVLLPFVEQTWPIIEAIVNGADLDEGFCVPVIKYIKRVSECLKRYTFAPLLPKALNVLTTIFHRTGSIQIFKLYDVFCGIYRSVYNTLELQNFIKPEHDHIVELGLIPPAPSASIDNPPCDTVISLSNTFTALSELCLQLFAGDTGTEEIDIIKHFFQFCVISTLVHSPRAFFSNVQCVIVLSEFAANILPGLTNASDLRLIGKFFRCLFEVDVTHALSPQESVEFNAFKNTIFEVMMTNIFLCIGTHVSPRTTIPTFAEMVHFFLVRYNELCTATLDLILSKPGFPSNEITMEQKKEFYGKIIKSQRSPDIMSQTLHDFSVICRGIHSTFLADRSLRP